MKGSITGPPQGLGSQIFGGNASDDNESGEDNGYDDRSEDESDVEQADEETLVTALEGASLIDSAWTTGPEYSPIYISTVPEYLPPPPKSKVTIAEVDDIGAGEKNKEGSWSMEGYENSLEVDHAFERFSRRLGHQGEQCVRYVTDPG